jgi:hypothetical protein
VLPEAATASAVFVFAAVFPSSKLTQGCANASARVRRSVGLGTNTLSKNTRTSSENQLAWVSELSLLDLAKESGHGRFIEGKEACQEHIEKLAKGNKTLCSAQKQ